MNEKNSKITRYVTFPSNLISTQNYPKLNFNIAGIVLQLVTRSPINQALFVGTYVT